ncbi:hypothetical protein [Marispirochaeta sp.]|uniref:hypothetical protein n=1 Tax=Marispirochaeta sp. TaxID=2038653 RepID=UPI0029C7103A|nr:hypothetical protein [Marispirochaeta sp.]
MNWLTMSLERSDLLPDDIAGNKQLKHSCYGSNFSAVFRFHDLSVVFPFYNVIAEKPATIRQRICDK